jgi:hypothetical protein
MDITGATGITPAQREALVFMGAVDRPTNQDVPAESNPEAHEASHPKVPVYSSKNIRLLLLSGFGSEELRRLCYDEIELRPVYDILSEGTGKATLVDKLIEYAEQKDLLKVVLDFAHVNNPARYSEFEPYYLVDSDPNALKRANG